MCSACPLCMGFAGLNSAGSLIRARVHNALIVHVYTRTCTRSCKLSDYQHTGSTRRTALTRKKYQQTTQRPSYFTVHKGFKEDLSLASIGSLWHTSFGYQQYTVQVSGVFDNFVDQFGPIMVPRALLQRMEETNSPTLTGPNVRIRARIAQSIPL